MPHGWRPWRRIGRSLSATTAGAEAKSSCTAVTRKSSTSFVPTRTSGAGGTIRPSVDPWFPWSQSPPRDPFETGAPEKGIHLRVRTAWTNTTQGQLVEPLSQFVSLTVDGVKVDAEEATKRAGRNRNALSDHYYLWRIPEATPEEHNATAVVRVLESGEELSKNIAFGAKS